MIQREIESKFVELVKQYPVVSVYGPRQSGKTTLVRSVFPDYRYVNLEDFEAFALARRDYKGFLKENPAPLIIDEIQRVPELTSAIQVAVDENRSLRGQYILTGSHQPLLMQTISQSLAGRTAILELMPLTVGEILSKIPNISTEDLILKGSMPAVYSEDLAAEDYYKAYISTYVERDVHLVVNIREQVAFRNFMTFLAGRVGQLLNLSSISDEIGMPKQTLSNWLSILEASYIVFRLQPYFANISKRLVKTPKLYFTDVGLAARLLGIVTKDQLVRDPLRGNLFENMIVSDIRKQRLNKGKDTGLTMMRSHTGVEVDAVVQEWRHFRPVEIKSARTYHSDFARNLQAFEKFIPKDFEVVRPTVVYDGDTHTFSNGVEAVNFRDFKVDG